MFNLRFKCTVISSWHMVLHAVPKANKMIANKNRYSETERFVYAKWIINYMRKQACQNKNQGVWQRKYSDGQQLHNVS